jgi:putative membrane protein
MGERMKKQNKPAPAQSAAHEAKARRQSRMRSILYRSICGVVLGIGCVLPGVSGGILAISLGMYEKMLHAIGTLFQNFKQNMRYLLPLGIGGVIGILLTSNVLSLVIAKYEV